ncbi:lipid-A-disaccharide synthase [Xylanibacter ruminicola]|uniref:Lipid-A-disaccharide synthase n=1 Tax=Xylanibacter ruminicola TaxID=839 RepID=A0A1H4EWD3_XYLRU|nr:lipid-A-disaccharide synthase [Xylanibacter ruminicola]SEA89177.1 lipid-A-disaccharide synthase [Xylanibacter ruminicola]
MKYYLIVGEASGDLHASHLMQSLKDIDAEAEFRFFGGDLMTAVGGTRVRHYKELAYMGFIPVLLHLRTIFRHMKMCKQDVVDWQPDCLILVDYPGFNLKIAEYIKSHTNIPVYYYISPKIWAWKEYRIKNIKRDVDQLLSILPFEVDFFENKHHYPIHYVGNPTADEVREFLQSSPAAKKEPVIALLAGSRKQEIKDNLPAMLQAVKPYENDYQIVVAGAPGIEPSYYQQFMQGSQAGIVFGQTYALLAKAHAALVTSGTATLETCLFGVPQVVCYKIPMPAVLGFLRRHFLKVKYVSLVNLVAGREVVKELLEDFSVASIRSELEKILSGSDRERMLQGYLEVKQALGDKKAPENAAQLIVDTFLLRQASIARAKH